MQAHELPPEGLVFETQAGRFTILPAPPEFPRRNAASHHPLVLWESPAGRVLYVGNAAYTTLASAPEQAVDVAILGQHPAQRVQPADVRAGGVILLPAAADDAAPGAEVVGLQECRRWVLPVSASEVSEQGKDTMQPDENEDSIQRPAETDSP